MNKLAAHVSRFINLAAVNIPPRQRREMSEEGLEHLKASIVQDGLFHAPVLRRDADGNHFLVAGERRLRAMKALHDDRTPFYYNRELVPEHCIPFTDTDSPDEIATLTKELNENLMREELSWQDRVRALSDISKLRSAVNPKLSHGDVAKEIVDKTNSRLMAGTVAQEISRALLTAEFLDDPDVKKAKSETFAFNMATRKLRDEFAAQLSASSKSVHTFIHGDSTNIILDLLDRFDCFIIDPPYGVNAQTFHPGNSPAEHVHEYLDTPEAAVLFCKEMLWKCKEVATDEAHLWMFCDVELFIQLRDYARNLGWTVFRTPLIWNKGSTGYILRQANIRRGYELLMFMQRSESRGLSQVLQDVITVSSRDGEKVHAAQKPVALYELLLKLSTSGIVNPKVLDPCCGSGTIFHAAQTLKISATGIELDPNFAKQCQSTLIELEVKDAD